MFTVLTGARQGLSYGTKIRLPDALVMTFLFKKGTLEEKILGIVRMAFIHARNLSLFVACYKASLLGLGMADSPPPGLTPGRPSRAWHPALAGALGGYLVWGNYSSVNYQVRQRGPLAASAMKPHRPHGTTAATVVRRRRCRP